MAHFYAHAQGSRGETHRLGGKENGAQAGVRGWKDGVTIYATYNKGHERNEYEIVANGGSSHSFNRNVGTLIIDEASKRIVFRPDPRRLDGKDDIVIAI